MNIINEMDFIFDSFDVSGLASPVLFLHFILLCKSTFKWSCFKENFIAFYDRKSAVDFIVIGNMNLFAVSTANH